MTVRRLVVGLSKAGGLPSRARVATGEEDRSVFMVAVLRRRSGGAPCYGCRRVLRAQKAGPLGAWGASQAPRWAAEGVSLPREPVRRDRGAQKEATRRSLSWRLKQSLWSLRGQRGGTKRSSDKPCALAAAGSALQRRVFVFAPSKAKKAGDLASEGGSSPEVSPPAGAHLTSPRPSEAFRTAPGQKKQIAKRIPCGFCRLGADSLGTGQPGMSRRLEAALPVLLLKQGALT